MKKLVLNNIEKDDDRILMRFDCDFTVTTAGDGYWGCEAGRKVRVSTIDLISQAYCKGVDLHVRVGHDSDWDIYSDTGFVKAISGAVGFFGCFHKAVFVFCILTGYTFGSFFDLFYP